MRQHPRDMIIFEFLRHYLNPRVFLPLITGTEWDENWKSWPHCNGQAGCWMHYPTELLNLMQVWPGCWCKCCWCRLARKVRK